MNFPNQISGTFSKNITLGIGSLRVYKGGSLFLTFTQANIVVVENSFTIDVSNLFSDNGNYFITFDLGLFKNGTEIFQGVSDPTKWMFTIASGQYSNTDYSNDYLTN